MDQSVHALAKFYIDPAVGDDQALQGVLFDEVGREVQRLTHMYLKRVMRVFK